ncbi:MAG: GNAT family N-acetyltransferase [Ktedonobacteraceae bacterium]|nr:GNAT family N-acetyltransferase [Ktedonobacteraceae bacterium]
MQKTFSKIETYVFDMDVTAIFELWQQTVGQKWPLSITHFRQTLASPEARHFVAREGEQIVGLLAGLKRCGEEAEKAHIAALLVAPAWQRKGIGTALYNTALEHFKAEGVRHVLVGGGWPRFWPGIPTNLPAGLMFFQAQGWHFDSPVYDLVQNLHTYSTPPYVQSRISKEQITFELATHENIDEVLTFEMREFPGWADHFQRVAGVGDYSDIVMARDATGEVVATLATYSKQSHPSRCDVLWQPLLGNDAGAIGCVGVAANERGRGIGLGLVAWASELLRDQGLSSCYIDWVSLTQFYARLGYEKWRAYSTGELEL